MERVNIVRKKNRPPGISIIWAFSGSRARGAQDYLFSEYELRLRYALQHWKKALEDYSLAIETKILNVCFHLVVHPAYHTVSQWVLKNQHSFEQYWRLCDWSLFLPLSPSSAELQEVLVLFFCNTWTSWAMSSTARAARHCESDWDQLVAIGVLRLQQKWPLQRNLGQPNMLISFAAFRRIIAIQLCSR